MIQNPDIVRRFEDDLIRRARRDFRANFRVFEALWEHARAVVLRNPGFDRDLVRGVLVDLGSGLDLPLVARFDASEREASSGGA